MAMVCEHFLSFYRIIFPINTLKWRTVIIHFAFEYKPFANVQNEVFVAYFFSSSKCQFSDFPPCMEIKQIYIKSNRQ